MTVPMHDGDVRYVTVCFHQFDLSSHLSEVRPSMIYPIRLLDFPVTRVLTQTFLHVERALFVTLW